MTLTEQITADQAAVATAQTALDASTKKLADDQAALAAVAPHLTLLDQIEAELNKVEDGVEDALKAGIDALKLQIKPLVAQIRALFNA